MADILIIDDDPHVLQQLTELLGAFGHKTNTSLYPGYLFELLEHQPADLILLDVHMPEVDGLTLLRQLKADERWNHLPVIMLTSDSHDELLVNCFEAGAFDFINKPAREPVLKARVSAALQVRAHILALERENERKSRELEDARQLQLAMLPESLPEQAGYSMAAYLETATEVGGDYYDWERRADGSLILAVGDATGHGLKAGAMVTAVKGLFKLLARSGTLDSLLASISGSLRKMGFGRTFMALTLGRLDGDRLEIAHAGMPLTLVYRADSKQVEVIQPGGFPLGVVTFKWTTQSVNLAPGDVVLFLSDGLPERFNPHDAMFGWQETQDGFAALAHLDPPAIVAGLAQAGDNFADGRPRDDDVTFLVLKKNAAD